MFLVLLSEKNQGELGIVRWMEIETMSFDHYRGYCERCGERDSECRCKDGPTSSIRET